MEVIRSERTSLAVCRVERRCWQQEDVWLVPLNAKRPAGMQQEGSLVTALLLWLSCTPASGGARGSSPLETQKRARWTLI